MTPYPQYQYNWKFRDKTYIGPHVVSSERVPANTNHPLQANKLHIEIDVYFVLAKQEHNQNVMQLIKTFNGIFDAWELYITV
jgi:hypothetical protein